MHKPRFTYILTTMTFLAVVSWLSIRAYENMIGQIYYSPMKKFFRDALHLGPQEPGNSFKVKVAVFRSQYTANNFGDPKKYEALIAAWIRILSYQHIASDVIDSKELTSPALNSYNVLLLPSASYLSDEELASIKEFASQRGHGLIFTGAAGSYHEDGEWREISLAAEIIGAEDIKEPPSQKNKAAYMILDGRSSLAANIPPGLRLGVSIYNRPVSVKILEPRSKVAAYWEENEGAVRDTLHARAGIVSGSYGGGKFVWMGFTLGSAIDPFGVKVGEILARNILAYASFRPIFAKEHWPRGKQAAVVFAQEMDERLESTKEATALFSDKKIPCTFFCAANSAAKYPAAFKTIYSNPIFEVGLSEGRAYRDDSRQEQKEILVGGKRLLETVSGRPILGFSPTGGAYDKDTLKALLDSGYSYLAGKPEEFGPPLVIQARKPMLRVGRDLKLLVEFPHVGVKSEIFTKANRESNERILQRLKQDFDSIYAIGGFYNFSFPSEILKNKHHAEILSKFLDYVKSKDVWLANFSEVAAWSSRWILVDVESAKASEARSTLTVTNSSPGEIDQLKIHMYFPGDNTPVSVSAEKLGGEISIVSHQKDKATIEIRGLRGEGLVFFVDKNSAL